MCTSNTHYTHSFEVPSRFLYPQPVQASEVKTSLILRPASLLGDGSTTGVDRSKQKSLEQVTQTVVILLEDAYGVICPCIETSEHLTGCWAVDYRARTVGRGTCSCGEAQQDLYGELTCC